MNTVSKHQYSLNSSTGKWTIMATILASSMAFIDGTALNVILPSLQRDLDASGADLFWVLNSYLLMLAALIIVGGSLGDKLGRVKVFKWGIIIFTIGSALCGIAPTVNYLIAFRTLQGIGGALMIPGSLAIISAVFSKEEKGKAIGTWSSVTTIVTICGPVLGGALADIGLWRYIFYINVPLGAISIAALHFKVPESKEEGASKVDWLGAFILVGCLSFLTFGFLEMPEWGYDHWIVVTCLIIGTVLIPVFILAESKVQDPMVPLGLFRNSTFSGVNILSFTLYAGLGAIMLFLSLNIIQIQGYSQLQAGMTFLPFSFLMIILGRKMGGYTDKFGARRFLIIGPILTGTGMVLLSLVGITAGPSDYWTTYFPPFLLFAGGMAITVVPLTTAVMNCVDESKAGIASGINNSVTRISGTFVNAILGAVAIYWFADFVLEQLDMLTLTTDMKEKILSETLNLGEAKAPDLGDPDLEQKVSNIFRTSFVETYKHIGFWSAGLAYISAIIAFFMVKENKK